MSVEASLAEILAELRNVQEDISEIKADGRYQQDKAEESRTRMHARLDQQQAAISEIEKSVLTTGAAVEAQRQSTETLTSKIDKDIAPAVAEWGRVKTLGAGFSGLMIAAGIAGTMLLYWAGDIAVTIARRWLRID